MRRVAAHDPDQRPRSTAAKNGAWNLIRGPIILAFGGICVGLVGYLAYVLISILATA